MPTSVEDRRGNVHLAGYGGLSSGQCLNVHRVAQSIRGCSSEPMANCYVCGRPISEGRLRLRRKVKTGEWVRRRYPKPHANELQTHYGMRVVCRNCARRIDQEKERDTILSHLHVILALVALIVFLLLRGILW
jgi:predicted nucleic acid-binding Zn ribbon protein